MPMRALAIGGGAELTVPVLIVGAGPAGLTASLALRRYGVGHVLVEQYPGTAHTPRAHIVNQRSVEILRHPDGDGRRAALRDAVALSDYQFNAHGIELGYRYHSAAVVEDGSPEPVPARDPQLYYQATTRPGARVPHARLERDGVRLSTLDLPDGLRFALLTGPGGEVWAEAAAKAATRTGIAIDVHAIGSGTLLDPYGEWEAVRGVGTTGCVLVRPDRHVAWRAERFRPDSAGTLTAVIQQVLGAPPQPLALTASARTSRH